MALSDLLRAAYQRRLADIERWTEEGSDSYRLFHGAVEGRPGLSVDRYGALTLAQVAGGSSLTEQESQALVAFMRDVEPWVLAQREGSRLLPLRESIPGLWRSTFWCRELGLEFAVQLDKAHRDPQLFLDFRAAKRALARRIADMATPVSLLNLFAYTCSIGCHGARAGASEVVNVDFSAGNLAWGQKNFRRNRLTGQALFLDEDCIGTLWALTGRGRRKKLPDGLGARSFNVVVVDPPAFSKGKFATVDLVNDPETVYGPAWEVVAPGGLLVAANNSAKVTRDQFEQRLGKLLDKRSGCGTLAELEWVAPEADFPSFDDEPPLKVAFCRKN